MARKPKTYTVDMKSKKVIMYRGMTRTAEDNEIIGLYLAQGFKATYKDKAETIEDMRKALAKDEKDAETLKAFNEAYSKKDKEGKGYHEALKIYTKWKKEKKEETKK